VGTKSTGDYIFYGGAKYLWALILELVTFLESSILRWSLNFMFFDRVSQFNQVKKNRLDTQLILSIFHQTPIQPAQQTVT